MSVSACADRLSSLSLVQAMFIVSITNSKRGFTRWLILPRPNGLRFSCGPKPAAAQMNLFL